MRGCDGLQPREVHGPCTQDELTGAGVEQSEEVEEAVKGVEGECGEVGGELHVVGDEAQ